MPSQARLTSWDVAGAELITAPDGMHAGLPFVQALSTHWYPVPHEYGRTTPPRLDATAGTQDVEHVSAKVDGSHGTSVGLAQPSVPPSTSTHVASEAHVIVQSTTSHAPGGGGLLFALHHQTLAPSQWDLSTVGSHTCVSQDSTQAALTAPLFASTHSVHTSGPGHGDVTLPVQVTMVLALAHAEAGTSPPSRGAQGSPPASVGTSGLTLAGASAARKASPIGPSGRAAAPSDPPPSATGPPQTEPNGRQLESQQKWPVGQPPQSGLTEGEAVEHATPNKISALVPKRSVRISRMWMRSHA